MLQNEKRCIYVKVVARESGVDALQSAFLAPAFSAVVLADARSAAILAPRFSAFVLADARPPAILAPASLAVVRAF